MKEILGQELKIFFENSKLEGIPTYIGDDYEVWVVEDATFAEMSEMTEELFRRLCPDGWWRYSLGSILGTPYVIYKVNGHDLIAWDERHENERCCKGCSDLKNGMCEGTDDDICNCIGERCYPTLFRYICDEIGASTEKNVCAIAVDLAKYNGLSLGELFHRYQG